jgi:hypothetical protein
LEAIGQGKKSDNNETAALVTADPLVGGSESSKKKRPNSRASFNSDTAGLVMADPLANLKANFQSLKAHITNSPTAKDTLVTAAPTGSVPAPTTPDPLLRLVIIDNTFDDRAAIFATGEPKTAPLSCG